MYLRCCSRTANGRQYDYWALVETQRTARGPRQRVVAYLDEQGRLGIKQAAAGQSEGLQTSLFEPTPQPEWVEVDLRRVIMSLRLTTMNENDRWRRLAGSGTVQTPGIGGLL